MEVKYSEDGKHAYFNNETFTRDDKTGYFLTTSNNKHAGRRLHRAVWEFHNTKIPKGYEVHHIDHDKSNNEIGNLQLLTVEEHRRLHGKEASDEERRARRDNMLSNAVPAAAEWHSSDIGKQWHREQYQRTKDRLHAEETLICQQCGKEYKGVNNGRNRFCSNVCKSAWRRKHGNNLEKRICCICGNEFYTDKYKHAKTCSPKCAGMLKAGKE